MRTGLKAWGSVAVTAIALAAWTGGCSNDDTKSSPAAAASTTAEAGPACSAGAKDCLTSRVARVCPSDGSGWLTQQCGAGEICSSGTCQADANGACVPGLALCVNDATALRCKADGKGLESVACPADTRCVNGQCAGACVVGSMQCMGSGAVATCADGKSYTPTACSSGQLCVKTTDAPVALAACKAAECTPANNNCGAVCGDMTNPAADATKALSRCVETPNGYKWQVTACAPSVSCAPGISVCAGQSASEAACATECLAGSSRCTPTLDGIQTCGTDGKWAGTTACSTDPKEVCFGKPNDRTHAVCGPQVCALASAGYNYTAVGGACAPGGKIRLCGTDGKLAATATSCATGQCGASGAVLVDGLTPGACRSDCQSGDERCTANGSTSFQSCQNGLWSAPAECTLGDGGTAACFNDLSAATGRPAKVCGVCQPGQSRCVATADGGPSDAGTQTCDATGQWALVTTCALGHCSGGSCIAACVPGKTICTGASKAILGTPYVGHDSFGTCTAQGEVPTTGLTACAGTTTCRSVNGEAILVGATACLECVGTAVPGGNEDGVVDTRCTNAAGTATTGGELQTCASDNTWTAQVTNCSDQSKTCVAATVGSANKFDTCFFQKGHFRSQSYYALDKRWASGGATCQKHGRPGSSKDYGPPTQCGVVPDCCSNQCTRATPASLAHCQ